VRDGRRLNSAEFLRLTAFMRLVSYGYGHTKRHHDIVSPSFHFSFDMNFYL
jgi:hypothetical protein